MTDAAPQPGRASRASGTNPRIVAGSLLALVVVVVSAVAAWPIYRSPAFLLLVGAATVLAAGIAATAWRLRWGGWATAGVTAGVLLVAGVPLAVPSRLGGPLEALRGLGDLAAGALFGWKDLVTVDLPVGSYRNLLVPALVVFLVGTAALLLLSWRADRGAYAAVPIGLAMVSFGLFFGRSDVSAPLVLGPIALHAPIETALGLGGLLGGMLWLAWRTHDDRVAALQRAAETGAVQVSRRSSRADRRRTALGAGIVVASVAIAVAVVPGVARGADREVLRTAFGPAVDLSEEISPLSTYRGLFRDDTADEVLFTVTADGALPDRVRLATLDAYDGQVFRSGGAGSVDSGRFVRVPSVLDAGEGEPVDVEVTVGALGGVWMPTVGRLASVDFLGPRGAALAERFYYSASASGGVETADGGLREGDAYRLHAVQPDAPALADATPPGGVRDDVAVPESLRTWVERHASGRDGAALADLVGLLRERGYLSHGLTAADGATWIAELPDYSFQPSSSGHSLARIDAMFTRLLEREGDPRAVSSDDYVAAIGDDEQFSVAVALIARELGFPARVVLGARLQATEPGLATCEQGACRAQDLSAWTEVQSAGGEWIPVDVTPQFAQSPSLDVTEQRDPENVTDVRPEKVEEVVPPEPLQEDSGTHDPDDPDAGTRFAWVLPTLRIGGIALSALALLAGPFLAVLAAKALRRRGRRTRGAPAVRVAAGWDEYLDAAVDAGREAPRDRTRGEIAADLGTAQAPALAEAADRATFSDAAPTAEEAVAYWGEVDSARRALRHERGFWRRVAASVSLRSFVRQAAPAEGVRKRIAERGKRRAVGPVRSAS